MFFTKSEDNNLTQENFNSITFPPAKYNIIIGIFLVDNFDRMQF